MSSIPKEPVTETLHGHEISDPFRWLEDSNTQETQEWVEAQNARTRSVLDAIPERAEFKSRLQQLYEIGFIGSPVERKGRLFFERRNADENQPRLVYRDGLSGDDHLVVDPNQVNAQGTTALDWWKPSPDGRYVAYGLSTSGDEQSTTYIFDIESGGLLEETIPHTRNSSIGWLPNESGFYYTGILKTLPNPGDVSAYYHRAVYFHWLRTAATEDELVLPDDDDPETFPWLSISPDGATLVVTVQRGWTESRVYVRRTMSRMSSRASTRTSPGFSSPSSRTNPSTSTRITTLRNTGYSWSI